MKRIFKKSLCFLLVITSLMSFVAFAQDNAAEIQLGSDDSVKSGEEAAVTIDIIINDGFDIQGIQIEFGLSDNFPTVKNAEIVTNTTGWETISVSKNRLIAVGDIVDKRSQVVAKITFDIPDSAQPGEEYIFTIKDVICANAKEELATGINKENIKVIVSGNKPSDTQKPQDKSEDHIREEIDDNHVVTADKNNEQSTWKNPFADVSESDWFYSGVQFVSEKNFMNGTSANLFEPHVTLTRGMLVTILHRFEGCPVSDEFGFLDVGINMWYTNAVNWAASNGIVNGVGNNMFAPDVPITREQIAVIFYNYAKLKGTDLSAKKDLTCFSDFGKISDWAFDAVEWTVSSGLISGKDGNILDPTGDATRAQTSVIIKRYVDNIMSVKP